MEKQTFTRGESFTNPEEGMIPPNFIYADMGRILRLYGAIAARTTERCDIELLARTDDEEATGDYQWYPVDELDISSADLRLVQ